MDNEAHNSRVRLSGFAAARIWHHRLSRTTVPRPGAASPVVPACGRVRPRVCAELVLHPIKEKQNPRLRGVLPLDGEIRPEAADSRHAA
ncbi:hypothetical protein OH491_23175 [Termitidicoccus mucosus]|uniref:Uncharacterized protein n=1 Tax=Termitidicoccus mucosus TaxID=1184151 RepID=A0A178IQ56_9BACT|nr:hypothetical protein AW736_03295 [Opitutaceae bacterium TSB47]